MATTPYAARTDLDSYIASINHETTVDIGTRGEEADMALAAATEAIDDHCHRVFCDHGDTATDRVFEPESDLYVALDDCREIALVEVDEQAVGSFTTWADTQYEELPLNGVRHGRAGWPVEALRAVGDCAFPGNTRRATVRITAKWGWVAVPDAVKNACLIKAHRLLLRPGTPHGVAGFNGFGEVRLTREDQDVINLLEGYVLRKPRIA